jgi:hypothetical protein
MQIKLTIEKEYEIRLLGPRGAQLIFVTSKVCDDEAADHARGLMDRHAGFGEAEIWQGMHLVRKV